MNEIATVPSQEALESLDSAPLARPQHHTVHFYESDSALIDTLAVTLGGALLAGNSAMVIATDDHRRQLASYLSSRGLDLDLITGQDRLVLLDAQETLLGMTVDREIDPVLFRGHVGSVIARLESAAQGPEPRVVVFGEMVALLLAQGNQPSALQLESFWNQLATSHSFHLHCAYPLHLFPDDSHADTLRRISAEHFHTVSSIDATLLPRTAASLLDAILLEQRARLQETESHDRRRAEEALFRLAAIVESSDDAIVSKDLNGIINSWNSAAERILGYTADEIIGQPITLLIPSELRDEETEILRRLRAGQRIDHFQTVRVTKAGERIYVSLTVSPVKDHHGKIIGAAKILRDVTQQKKLEAALQTTERLASVGRLAATVAHEINNPLESVLNSIYLAKNQPEISEQTRGFLQIADVELGRVAHLAQQTLGFYRDNSHPQVIGLADLIQNVLGLYEGRLRVKTLQLEKRIETGVSIVTLQGELKQVLSNLLANAIDASPSGERILIRCRSCYQQPSRTPGVRITIADTGSGISISDQQKIFEPFFTTKKSVGTGLGLWITKDLLEKRGGSIQFRSCTRPGSSGTVMTIFLPATPPSPSMTSSSHVA